MLAYRQSCNAAALPRSAATNCNVRARASVALRPAARSRLPLVTSNCTKWIKSWEEEAERAVKMELEKHFDRIPGKMRNRLEAHMGMWNRPADDYGYPSPQLLAKRAGVLMSLFPGSTEMWNMVTVYPNYILASPPEETVRRLVRLSTIFNAPVTDMLKRNDGWVAARALYNPGLLDLLESTVGEVASALEECLPGVKQPLALAQLLVSRKFVLFDPRNFYGWRTSPNIIKERLRVFGGYSSVVFPSVSRVAARGYPLEDDTYGLLCIWLMLDDGRSYMIYSSYTHFLYESGAVAGSPDYPDVFAPGDAGRLPSEESDAGKVFWKYHKARVAELHATKTRHG